MSRLKRKDRRSQRSRDPQELCFVDLNQKQKHINREKKKAYLMRKTAGWKSRVMKEGKCHYCSTPVTWKTATMDHIVPLSRGGRSTPGNIAVSCKDCNTQKKDHLPVEWLVFDRDPSAG